MQDLLTDKIQTALQPEAKTDRQPQIQQDKLHLQEALHQAQETTQLYLLLKVEAHQIGLREEVLAIELQKRKALQATLLLEVAEAGK